MSQEKIVIVSAKRSPICALGGALSPLHAHDIGKQVIADAFDQAKLRGADIDETILGQVLTAGAGMNPARQAARGAGIHDGAPAMSINQVCGSGLRAIALAAQQIQTSDAKIIVAGGQESMSNAPHVANLRKGKKLGDINFVDTMMHDGLSDIFFGYPMGNTAENVAKLHNISREQQDAFALSSQQKASAAQQTGAFKIEITPIKIPSRKGEIIVETDEHIRHDADANSLAKLRPAFLKDGTVTAGNASGINDGAAALVLMSEAEAMRRNITPLASIASWAHTGLAPEVMGLGPISASKKALARVGWSVEDVDIWEANEAFAAQALAVISELGLDPQKVNINGGAIALGHPIGASGARNLVTLIHLMQAKNAKKGVATLCIGGGMGIAMCLENYEGK